jgi:hypothetical protein
MKERSDGILLRRRGPGSPQLSWEDTALEIAATGEDWSVWDPGVGDGLDEIPWERAGARRVVE